MLFYFFGYCLAFLFGYEFLISNTPFFPSSFVAVPNKDENAVCVCDNDNVTGPPVFE